jgi:hypothetical protein
LGKKEVKDTALQSTPVLPALPLEEWQDTYTTLHLWTQIVGKIRLALSPMENQWWQVPLYPTVRGLTTSPLSSGNQIVQIDFDFINHLLRIERQDGEIRTFPFEGHSVASFYNQLMKMLSGLGVDVRIWTVPVEVEERIPFEQDEKHATYDPEAAIRFWQVYLRISQVMKIFRARFTGKASPVQFFWGGFDLAASRFIDRRAPLTDHAYHVALYVMQEAAYQEESSCGFWPGEGLGEAGFYAYHYPEPPGFREAAIQPPEAYFHQTLGEFILPYEVVRTSPAWKETLLSFFESTYEAGARLAGWDRDVLEQS